MSIQLKINEKTGVIHIDDYVIALCNETKATALRNGVIRLNGKTFRGCEKTKFNIKITPKMEIVQKWMVQGFKTTVIEGKGFFIRLLYTKNGSLDHMDLYVYKGIKSELVKRMGKIIKAPSKEYPLADGILGKWHERHFDENFDSYFFETIKRHEEQSKFRMITTLENYDFANNGGKLITSERMGAIDCIGPIRDTKEEAEKDIIETPKEGYKSYVIRVMVLAGYKKFHHKAF